jgi:hypothetical protein
MRRSNHLPIRCQTHALSVCGISTQPWRTFSSTVWRHADGVCGSWPPYVQVKQATNKKETLLYVSVPGVPCSITTNFNRLVQWGETCAAFCFGLIPLSELHCLLENRLLSESPLNWCSFLPTCRQHSEVWWPEIMHLSWHRTRHRPSNCKRLIAEKMFYTSVVKKCTDMQDTTFMKVITFSL